MGRARRGFKRPWGAEHPELDLDRASGGRRSVAGRDSAWTVQSISSARATKEYRCPGCQQSITTGTAHVVAWAQDSLLGPGPALEARRHWHTACWERAEHRL